MLLNASTGAAGAIYEYSPSGEPLRAQINDSTLTDQPFRFSTKFTDLESGLVYYGHRYYAPRLGRFINRDPIEESGGVNLYGFSGNDAINRWDVLGLAQQTYDLEGVARELIGDGEPIPPGRWITPTGGFDSRNGGWGLSADTINPYTGQPLGVSLPGNSHRNSTPYLDADPTSGVRYEFKEYDGNGTAVFNIVENYNGTVIGSFTEGSTPEIGNGYGGYDSYAALDAYNAMIDGMGTQSQQIGGNNMTATAGATSTAAASGSGGGSALGNALRNIPLIGGLLGAAGDIVAGVGNTALGLVSLGQSGTLGRGVGQIGSGVASGAEILGTDVLATLAGAAGTIYTTSIAVADLVTLGNVNSNGNPLKSVGKLVANVAIPEYGMLGGLGWGLSQSRGPSSILNQADVASYHHDGNLNEIEWFKRSYTTKPDSTWVGPVGAAYTIVGTIPFVLKGLIDGEHYP